MRAIDRPLPTRQRGAVLIIALLLLVVLTLLGTSSMQNTVLQERMAGNMNQRNLALQASEAVLREAEAWLAGLGTLPVESSSPSASEVWKRDAPGPTIFGYDSNRFWWTQTGKGCVLGDTVSWWDCNPNVLESAEYAEAGGQAPPRYAIEHRYFRKDDKVVGFGPPTGRDYHRITARGLGQADTARATLQSHFVRRYN